MTPDSMINGQFFDAGIRSCQSQNYTFEEFSLDPGFWETSPDIRKLLHSVLGVMFHNVSV